MIRRVLYLLVMVISGSPTNARSPKLLGIIFVYNYTSVAIIFWPPSVYIWESYITTFRLVLWGIITWGTKVKRMVDMGVAAMRSGKWTSHNTSRLETFSQKAMKNYNFEDLFLLIFNEKLDFWIFRVVFFSDTKILNT